MSMYNFERFSELNANIVPVVLVFVNYVTIAIKE